MAIQILRDLHGLRVEVIHPPDNEGVSLVEHLRRIGCTVSTAWPVPDMISPVSDIVLLAIDHDSREPLRRLFKNTDRIGPTLIAIVGYENPSILQIVLETGVHAVIERPVRPFGLLTHLAVARSLWSQQQDAARKAHKLERKLVGIQRIQRAKSILMTAHALSEDAAYQRIRKLAMAKARQHGGHGRQHHQRERTLELPAKRRLSWPGGRVAPSSGMPGTSAAARLGHVARRSPPGDLRAFFYDFSLDCLHSHRSLACLHPGPPHDGPR